MDFQELLSVADYNKAAAKSEASVKRYSTVLAPPKKPLKTGVQSENVKRFLANKKAEEERKASQERQKKQELLVLRAQSTKNTKKAKIMASRTKDNDFSKIKLTNDEIEAKKKREDELIRQNLMDKVERMKARIDMEEKEKLLPKKRKRKAKQQQETANIETVESKPSPLNGSKFDSKYDQPDKVSLNSKVKRPAQRPPVPQMSFHDLLKVAATKQFERVEIPKKKEEERPMTKKERKQMLEEQERLRRKKELLQRGIYPSTIKVASDAVQTKKPVPSIKKNSNVSPSERSEDNKITKKPVVVHVEKNRKSSEISQASTFKNNARVDSKNTNVPIINKTNNPKNILHDTNRLHARSNINTSIKKDAPIKRNGEKSEAPRKANFPAMDEDVIAAMEKKFEERMNQMEAKYAAALEQQARESANKNSGPIERKPESSQQPHRENSSKPLVAKMGNRTLTNVRERVEGTSSKREYLAYSKNAAQNNRKLLERKPVPFHKNPYLDPPRRLLEPQRPPRPIHKRRIESEEEDDDDEDDMKDFIDDRPSQNEDDYSKYIQEIFGYDKSKYADDDDDEVMETSFAEQMKEETRSARLGYLEDLEEEKKEKREKDEMKRKKKMKK